MKTALLVALFILVGLAVWLSALATLLFFSEWRELFRKKKERDSKDGGGGK